MDTIIEVRPAEGGNDAATFADELTQALRKYLTRSGQQVRHSYTDRAHTLTTSAPKRDITWLSGTHKAQRIPQGVAARHTSAATVAILDRRLDPEQVGGRNKVGASL